MCQAKGGEYKLAAMVNRQAKVARARVVIVAGLGAVVGLVAIVGLVYSLGFGGADERWFTLDERPDASGPVEVVEYFSWACIHCRNLDPLIDEWRAGMPDGVNFRRVHVSYSGPLRVLARTHVALLRHGALEANHQRIFRAIHDRNRQFLTAEAMADFVDGYGIDRAAFLASARSAAIAAAVEREAEAYAAVGIAAVPALVVDGKYVINLGAGRKQAIDALGDLVEELLAGRTSQG